MLVAATPTLWGVSANLQMEMCVRMDATGGLSGGIEDALSRLCGTIGIGAENTGVTQLRKPVLAQRLH